MTKTDNYLQKLAELIQASANVPFKWGVMDCCVFAAKAMDIQYDTNLVEETKSYTTEIGAHRIIKKKATDLSSFLDTYLKPIEPSFAQRGDIVLFMTDNGQTTGLMWLNGVWSVAPDGLKLFENVQIIKAWREPLCHQQ